MGVIARARGRGLRARRRRRDRRRRVRARSRRAGAGLGSRLIAPQCAVCASSSSGSLDRRRRRRRARARDVVARDLRGGRARCTRAGRRRRGRHLRRDRARHAADGAAACARRAIEELQAASAVGQGQLYRVYDELLREHGVQTAQVLLTFFDMSARTHYLNARRTLRKLLDWRVVPVINENDTTDHGRDHLRRQRLPRRAGRDPAGRRAAACC